MQSSAHMIDLLYSKYSTVLFFLTCSTLTSLESTVGQYKPKGTDCTFQSKRFSSFGVRITALFNFFCYDFSKCCYDFLFLLFRTQLRSPERSAFLTPNHRLDKRYSCGKKCSHVKNINRKNKIRQPVADRLP